MHIGGRKRENKWNSDDPNSLRRVIDEIRQDVGFDNKETGAKGKPSKLSHFMNHKLQGGDNELIDGPEEYAFNKLHQREIDEPMEAYPPQVKPSAHYNTFNRGQFNYPYNAVYDNYQPTNEAYQENYSYKGLVQPHGNQFRRGGHNSDQASWYSYESYNSMGHPYYQGYHGNQGHYNYSPNYSYGQPLYERGLAPNQPQGPAMPKQPPRGVERESQHLQAPPQKQVGNTSPYSHSKNSYQDDEQSDSSDDDQGNNSSSHKRSSPSKTKNQLKRFKQLIEAKPSNVLHVKGIENEDVSSELLNSLFGNFGNIVKILFVKHKQAAFIVYDCQDLATIAKEMLTNLRFMDCHLKVHFD